MNFYPWFDWGILRCFHFPMKRKEQQFKIEFLFFLFLAHLTLLTCRHRNNFLSAFSIMLWGLFYLLFICDFYIN